MTPNIVKGSNSLPGDRYDDPNHPRNQADFQPDSLKSSSGAGDNSDTSGGSNLSSRMDGDHSAKTMDAGANAATATTDMAQGIHEDGQQLQGAGTKETGHGTSVFSKDGAIGSQFTKDGNIGGIAEKIGGPLASDGAIGKNFNADGAVGGTFQQLAEKNENH